MGIFSDRKRFGVTSFNRYPNHLAFTSGGEVKYNEGCSIEQNRSYKWSFEVSVNAGDL